MKLILDPDLVNDFHIGLAKEAGLKLTKAKGSAALEYEEGDDIGAFLHLQPLKPLDDPAEIIKTQVQVDPPEENVELVIPGIRDRRLDSV